MHLDTLQDECTAHMRKLQDPLHVILKTCVHDSTVRRSDVASQNEFEHIARTMMYVKADPLKLRQPE
jgi:hypothetical protein